MATETSSFEVLLVRARAGYLRPMDHCWAGGKGMIAEACCSGQCLVNSCNAKHRAEDSAACRAVVEQVRLLGSKN